MTASFVIRLYRRTRKIPLLDLDVHHINGRPVEANPKFRLLQTHPVGFESEFNGAEIELTKENVAIIEAEFLQAAKSFDNVELHRSYLRLVENSIV